MALPFIDSVFKVFKEIFMNHSKCLTYLPVPCVSVRVFNDYANGITCIKTVTNSIAKFFKNHGLHFLSVIFFKYDFESI